MHGPSCQEPDLRVSEIWASEDAWQEAWDGGLKAALSTAGVGLPEPEKLPVHEVWGSRVADDSRNGGFVVTRRRCASAWDRSG